MSMFLSVSEMNATFAKHPGKLLSDGRVIVYNLEFRDARHACTFLEPYPVGPKYSVVFTPSTNEIKLEAEEVFEFGPPKD